MARAERETRDYTKSDDAMLEQAQTMRNLFNADKSDFTAMYPHLVNPFSANWQADIDAAQALPTSDEESAELEVKSEDVETQMELARAQFQKLASYIKLLFPTSKAKQGIFGLQKYDNVRQSQTKMYDLMQLAYRKANSADYQADLIAAGFVQTEIDELNTIAEALYDANEAQEEFKQVIKLRTEERIEAYNKVWEDMKAVSTASKQVFVDDYTKQRQYLLYPEGGGDAPGKVQNLIFDHLAGTSIWDASPHSETYNLVYRAQGSSSDWLEVYSGPNTSAAFCPADGDWEFRCRGINSAGSGPWSDLLEITVGLPIPQNVTTYLGTLPDTLVYVNWDGPIPGASRVNVYKSIVPIGDPPGAYIVAGEWSQAPPYYEASTPGVRYYFYCTAYGHYYESPPSEVVFVDS